MLCFFDNGICFRSDLLSPLIRMLEDLRAKIRALPTFRYFSSSLLVLYDGAVCPDGLRQLEGAPGADQEFERIFERARNADEAEINYSSENTKNNSTPTSPELPSLRQDSAQSASVEMSDAELAQARRGVDLRMIDFAHATHEGYKDRIHYEGLDESYLVGLDSLIGMFTDMRQTYCEKGRGLRL